MQGFAGIVEHPEESSRLRTVQQIAHDLVVEERDGLPCDAFAVVFLLFVLRGWRMS